MGFFWWHFGGRKRGLPLEPKALRLGIFHPKVIRPAPLQPMARRGFVERNFGHFFGWFLFFFGRFFGWFLDPFPKKWHKLDVSFSGHFFGMTHDLLILRAHIQIHEWPRATTILLHGGKRKHHKWQASLKGWGFQQVSKKHVQEFLCSLGFVKVTF